MGVMVIHQENRQFFDCLAPESHDHNFTSSAFIFILDQLKKMNIHLGGNVKKMFIYSDGALKTKENIVLFSNVATLYQV